MEYRSGEYVMYGAAGICRIDGREMRSFDGVHEVEYCRLIPYGEGSSVYFVPLDTLESKVRRLHSREEVLAFIDSIHDIEPLWTENAAERRRLFGSMLKSDDYSKIFCLLKLLYSHKHSAGKKLASADEWLMKAAEGLVSQEFSLVLGIRPDEVESFITAKVDCL